MITIQKCTLGIIIIVGLAGCASTEGIVEYTMIDPGKYENYNYTCEQLSDALKSTVAREFELQKLMAKASQSTGGEFVSLITYRTDYMKARADKRLVVKAQKEKKCFETVTGNGALSDIH